MAGSEPVRFWFESRPGSMGRETQRKGDIAVAKAIANFTEREYDVSVPLTESAPYDLIVDFDGTLQRVQVKYSSARCVDLRRIHSNSTGYVVKTYEDRSFDQLYVYVPNDGEFLIRADKLNKRSVTVTDLDRC